MVRVTKNEKEAILKSFPDAHIRRTMKRKSENDSHRSLLLIITRGLFMVN